MKASLAVQVDDIGIVVRLTVLPQGSQRDCFGSLGVVLEQCGVGNGKFFSNGIDKDGVVMCFERGKLLLNDFSHLL